MEKIIENSLIFSFIKKIFNKIATKWDESQLGWYVTRNLNDVKSNNSFIFRILNTFVNKTFSINIPGKIGEEIRESVILNLLSHYEFGVYALIFLIPVIPTMMCAGIAILTLFSFFLNSIVKRNFNIKLDSFWLTVTVLFSLYFIYAVTSFANIDSIKVFLLYTIFILFMFVCTVCASSPERLTKIIFLFSASGMLSCCYGIYQYFYGDNIGHAWVDSEMFSDISVRVYSTFENPNVFGEYLLLLIPICGVMIYASRRFIAKFYYFLVMVFAMVNMLLTQSRGCWIGLIFVALLFTLLVDRRLLILGIFGAMFMPMFLPESIIYRFTSIGNLKDSSTSYRVNIWIGTINMLKDYWLYGVGLGKEAFNKVYPLYSLQGTTAAHSHNLFLQLFSETGIFGLLTFIASLMISFKKILVGLLVGKKNIYGKICAGILCGLTGFLVQGMFDHSWYNYRVFAIFWIIIGLGIAARRCACDEGYTRNK